MAAVCASVVPGAYLGLLAFALAQYNDTKDNTLPPLGGLLKALGALFLFAGHATLSSSKERLAIRGAASRDVRVGGRPRFETSKREGERDPREKPFRASLT